MAKTFFDELLGEFGRILQDVGDRLEQTTQQQEEQKPTQQPTQTGEEKIITALGRCEPEYKTALTRLVDQTAVHVKQSNDPTLIDPFVRAALYTNRDHLAREALDGLTRPTVKHLEIRGLLHYDAGNFAISNNLFNQLDRQHITHHARYAHVSARERQGPHEPSTYVPILAGLESRVAPAAEMVGVAWFNKQGKHPGDYEAAEHFLAIALEQKPTAQRLLNLMTARYAQPALRGNVNDVDTPRLFQELRYEGNLNDVQRELTRTSINFPYLKMSNLFEVVGKVYAAK